MNGRVTAALGREAPVIQRLLRILTRQQVIARLWAKDPSLWTRTPAGSAVWRRIRERLGWLEAPQAMQPEAKGLMAFAREVAREGFTHALVIGMGGSSLCPEVCRDTFGVAPGYPALRVLRSIHPGEILRIERSLPLRATVFVVASKSGTTLETDCLARYLWARVQALAPRRAGRQFVALTDPGTPLETFASRRRFRKVFATSPEIGGRYGALSWSGLVPAALLGLDLVEYLARAAIVAHQSRPEVSPAKNEAVRLGAILAGLAARGRNKVTFVLPPRLASLGLWLEQLLAESTGKQGRGLVPVVGEPLGRPAEYGRDRLFVAVDLDGETQEVVPSSPLAALERAGHPVVRIRLRDTLDLAGEFFRWEVATAVAGAIMKVNPFDEPDVAASKAQTRRLLTRLRRTGRFPSRRPVVVDNRIRGCRVYAPGPSAGPTFAAVLHRFLRQARSARSARSGRSGSYVALMAYLEPTARTHDLLKRLRLAIRRRFRVATTFGEGPALLHSTGQLHKGGPTAGLFLQFTADDHEPLAIPGEPYGFPALLQASALGDYLALATRGRRLLEIHLGRDVREGLMACLEALR